MQIPGIVCVLPFLGAAVGLLPVSASAQESAEPPIVVLVPDEAPAVEPAPVIVERLEPAPVIVERLAPAAPPQAALAPVPDAAPELPESTLVIVIATATPPTSQSESYLQPAEEGDADLALAEAADLEEEDPEERYPVFSVGLSGSMALVEGAGGDIEPLASYGLDLAVRPLPFLVLALRRVGAVAGDTLRGTRIAIGATPSVALALRLGFFEPYVEVGVALQSRVAGEQDGAIGIAPHGALGARFFMTRWLSLGVEGALEVAASDAFLLTPSSLPQGAVWLSGGASVTFHVE